MSITYLLVMIILLGFSRSTLANSFEFSIHAGSADVALNEYARVTGRKLLFRFDVISRYRTNEVVGRYDEDQALAELIKDSGLVASFSDKGNLIIKTERPEGVPAMGKKIQVTDGKIGWFGRVVAALAGGLLSTSAIAEGASGAGVMEEVVVIGSYIKRDSFNSAAPITVIDAESIAESGAIQIGDLVADASFNYGSDNVRNGLSGADGVSTAFDLRGLGPKATLNLLDGRRRVDNDVNSIYPSVAIKRIEILRDGGSALYGTDAVSGVVNFIPVKIYDGLKFGASFDGDSRGTSDQKKLEVLGGFSSDRVTLVTAAEYEDRGRIPWYERPEYLRAGFTLSGFGNPGNFRVPTRDEFGVLTGTSVVKRDPGCGTDGSATDQGAQFNNTSGFIGPFGDCQLAYGSTWDSQSAREYLGTYFNLGVVINDHVRFELQSLYSKTKSSIRITASSSGGNVSLLPVIVGENPFNPFPAVDANGNAVLAQDLDGDNLPDRDANGVVILDPAGIPFNEDVSFGNWRPFGKTGTRPDGVAEDYAAVSPALGPEKISLTASLEFDIPGTSWTGSTAVSFQQKDDKEGFFYADSTSRLQDALVGRGGPGGDEYFNPFYSADPAQQNSQSVVNFIRQRPAATELMDRLRLVDFVMAGDLFKLPAGVVGVAVGGQYRQELSQSTPAEIFRLGDAWGAAIAPTQYQRSVKAVFGELAVPVLDNMEMQLAVRYEDSGNGLSSTDPKIAFLYHPLDPLSLRASWGTAFIAPDGDQLAGPINCFLGPVQDKILGSSSSFTSVCVGGNPDLEPESADVWNLGFTWNISPGLTLGMDYLNIDFRDRLVFTSAQDIINLDEARMNGAGVSGADWIASGQSDARIVRSTFDNSIVQVNSGVSNATEMTYSSVDLSVDYNFSLKTLGAFTVSLDVSYINDYTYQLLPVSARVQGAGKQNDGTGAVPPLPRVKSNAGVSWTKGNHAANVRFNHKSAVKYDSIVAGLAGFYGLSAFVPDEIGDWVQTDLQYRLTLSDLVPFGSDSETVFTVGILNAFDEMAQPIFHLGGYEARLQSPIGRQFYLRLTHDF
ncbi:MAG: TonB-dependent receptor plug domain-containing protein [Pseudomonadota bacterium]